MTLPSLLRRVGLDVPRGVTVDGRLITGRAAAAALAAGTATSMSPHTFHGGGGGDSPATSTPSAWWHDADARAADCCAVARAFPGFTLDDTDGEFTWRGTLDTGCGRFVIDVVADAAGGLPRIVPVSPRVLGRNEGRRGFRPSPHLYTNGHLCVADSTDWDAANHTTATAITWAAHWFAAYTDWRLGGRWPTEGYRYRAAA